MGQKSLVGYSPWGHRVGHDWATNTHAHTHTSSPLHMKLTSIKLEKSETPNSGGVEKSQQLLQLLLER